MQDTLRCAHCNVEIVDQSSMVERAGRRYCCANCARADEGMTRG